MPFESFFENLPLINSLGLRDGVRTLKLGAGYGVGELYVPTGTYATDIKLQSYLKVGTEPAGGAITAAGYFKTENTADIPNSQLATIVVRTTPTYDVFDAYGVQTHMTFSTSMHTTDTNAHLTALSAKVTFTGTPTISKGWITAGLFIIEGTGTTTDICYGVSIVQEAGTTGVDALLHLNLDVAVASAFAFAGTDGTGNMIFSNADTDTAVGSIKILINGVAKYLRFYAAEA